MESFFCQIIDVIEQPWVAVLLDTVLTIGLIIIYCRQNKIQKLQGEIQATSVNLNAADKLQTLYDAYFNLNRFLFTSRNEMFTPALVELWQTKERVEEFRELRRTYIQEVAKVDFFVSKETLLELRDYIDASLDYWNELSSLHITILPSYRELASDYDDVYREFQDSEWGMPVKDFMEDIASVDKEYKSFYQKFAEADRVFHFKSERLLNKFKAKEGIGSII